MKYLNIFLKDKRIFAGTSILLLLIIVAIFAPYIAPYSPHYMGFVPLQPPSLEHLLGTTATGQDVFSRVIWGTRISLLVGLLVGAFTTIISVALALFSGFFGGIVDNIISLIINVFLVIPPLPLMIVLAAYMPNKGMWSIIFVITITGWAWGARTLRPQVMSIRNRDFVNASVIVGENSFHIIFVDILPHILGLVVANFFGTAMYAVISEAGLEFIGLGNVNDISWGTILYWAENDQAIFFGLWSWLLVPGVLIALLGTSMALMNFAVDEIINPKLKGEKNG